MSVVRRILLTVLLTSLTMPCRFAAAADRSKLGGLEIIGDDLIQGKLPEPPQPGKRPPRPSGLTLEFDATWGGASGYRPLRIKVVPTSPLSSSRLLTIHYAVLGQPAVTEDLLVPAGAAGAETVLSLPQQGGPEEFLLDVYEDGKRIDELSAPQDPDEAESYRSGYRSYVYFGSGNQTAANAVMFIGFDHADVQAAATKLQTATPAGGNQGGWSLIFADVPDAAPTNVKPGISGNQYRYIGGYKYTASGATVVASGATSSSEPFLPDRWIDNSAIDHFVISLHDAQWLARLHPDKWAAIRKAVAAGATLCVYGIDSKWERLTDVERLLKFPDNRGVDAPDGKQRGWLSREDYFRWLKGLSAPPRANPVSDGPQEEDVEESPPPTRPTFVQNLAGALLGGPAPAVLIRPYFRGRVMAVAAEKPDGAVDFVKSRLIESADGRDLKWAARHGFFLDPRVASANKQDFWEFTIPGIGLTPVRQFMVLISLFVLAIGPINYWVLRRRHKLNLLVITVPASAAIVTGALLLYAVVGDGLGMRARVRSFTEIDCQTGDAVCWSRLSLYAGISPSSGLQFPGDVAVYPIQQDSLRTSQSIPRHEVGWEGFPPFNSAGNEPMNVWNQHLSKDWLPGRTPTQFLSVRVRRTGWRLDVASAGDGLKVVNRLATQIQQIVAADAAGNYFRGGQIPDGGEARLEPLKQQDALAGIQKALADNRLELPAGSRLEWYGDGYRRFSGYSYSIPYGGAPNVAGNQSVSQRDAILEQSLREWSTQLPPRSFVAIVDRSPEVVIGVDSAREEASLHVVAGHY